MDQPPPHCLSIRTSYVHVVTAFKNWVIGSFISNIKEFRPKFLGYIILKQSYTSHWMECLHPTSGGGTLSFRPVKLPPTQCESKAFTKVFHYLLILSVSVRVTCVESRPGVAKQVKIWSIYFPQPVYIFRRDVVIGRKRRGIHHVPLLQTYRPVDHMSKKIICVITHCFKLYNVIISELAR